MKIITVNLKVKDIKTMKTLIGANGLYPSRSELIRVAIRDFLIKELEMARNFPKFHAINLSDQEILVEIAQKEEENLYVRVPIANTTEGKQYKTYRIIQK